MKKVPIIGEIELNENLLPHGFPRYSFSIFPALLDSR